MKVLILGVTGMLGNAVFDVFSKDASCRTWGTLRANAGKRYFSEQLRPNLIGGIDVLDNDSLVQVIELIRPDVLINCVGLIKQIDSVNDPLSVLPINSMLPHRLAKLCALVNARLVHISTDCVFSGRKGMYTEDDMPDANDLYGKSKFIGEVNNELNAITLRTSIIGHELNSRNSLIDWFISQSGVVKGYRKAIFSGFPTVELARIILEYVLPKPELHGLYHVSSERVDKCSLLKLVAHYYGKGIEIVPDDELSIDRSLDSFRFRKATGYMPPSWPELVQSMYESRIH